MLVLKKPVPSRPVLRDKRDGTGQYWIFMYELGANLHKMNQSYGDENLIAVWSFIKKCDVAVIIIMSL